MSQLLTQGDDGGVPAICFDCCFLRDHPGGDRVPVLVGREKRTNMMLSHVMPFKGGGVVWLVGQLLRDLRKQVPTEKAFSRAINNTHLGCAHRCLQVECKI